MQNFYAHEPGYVLFLLCLSLNHSKLLVINIYMMLKYFSPHIINISEQKTMQSQEICNQPYMHILNQTSVCNIHVPSYNTAIKGYCNMSIYRMLLTCYWRRRWWCTWNYSETQSLQMFICSNTKYGGGGNNNSKCHKIITKYLNKLSSVLPIQLHSPSININFFLHCM